LFQLSVSGVSIVSQTPLGLPELVNQAEELTNACSQTSSFADPDEPGGVELNTNAVTTLRFLLRWRWFLANPQHFRDLGAEDTELFRLLCFAWWLGLAGRFTLRIMERIIRH
jgi:hypothetical protein